VAKYSDASCKIVVVSFRNYIHIRLISRLKKRYILHVKSLEKTKVKTKVKTQDKTQDITLA
jgi:hypothetical protein